MGDLVDHRDLRVAREHGVEVHLLDRHAAVLDAPARDLLEALDQRRGVGAAVRFDEAEDHVDAALLQRVRFLQHAVGLADPGREADVELQPPALGALDELEKVLRPRAGLRHAARA